MTHALPRTAERLETSWFRLLCASRVGTALAWMMYAGVLPQVAAAWGMEPAEAGLVQTAFHWGYGISLAVASSLVDRAGAKRVLLWSSWLTAVAAASVALGARSYTTGVVLFTVLGLGQGGTYTPSIVLAAQGIPSQKRGTAVGWLLAASSLGYFFSVALSAAASERLGYRAAFLVCAAGPAAGLIAAMAGLRSRPNLVERRGGSLRIPRDRRALLVTAGYAAHCWELLGMWAWTPALLSGALAGPVAAAAGIHLSGGLASLWMGRISDRAGRKRALVALGLAGAVCSFVIGWLPSERAFLLPFAALYGFTALGDSPVLAAAMTEYVAESSLGDAMAVRSALGFGAGGLAPLAFGAVLGGTGQAAPWGWSYAVLGCGGLLAALCALLLPAEAPVDGR